MCYLSTAHGCANINNEVARGGVTRTWFAPLGHNVRDVSALNPNYDVQFMINKKNVNLQWVKVHSHGHVVN
jgi:hypothetical protein